MKKLFLVTETFPYGTAEKTFILPELPELLKYYDVTIISHASETVVNDIENISVLPPEVKIVNLDIKMPRYRQIKYFIRFFLDRDGLKETKEILKSRKNILQRLYQSIGFYGLAMENFRLMDSMSLLVKDEEAIYYSYWYFYYTYSVTKNRKLFPNMKLITRTHGFDLYDERYTGTRQPFKRIMDKNIDRIFFISQQGKGYYLNRYNITDCEKYIVSRLGTMRTGDLSDTGRRENEKFRLVSCSSVIPLKRVDLIAQALYELTDEIEWIHFGSGSEFNRLVEQADELLKSRCNISYQFKGFVSNRQILEYYSTNYVDCFISTSSSEGIPISIQEAMSFGIPIIATAVGGVPELIENNGILMNANPSREEVSNAISRMLHLNRHEYEFLREQSFRIWQERYNAEVNRVKFVCAINKLYN
ncbi:MAG: glycosyltransferase [Lachnospiraceae bacterium]|nr:glycosyltransferase [Lachnospiraceae bacterium]